MTLLSAALFVFSVLLQTAVFAAPSAATAASGLKAGTVQGFEVDGDLKSGDASGNPAAIPAALIDGTLTNGDDWLQGASGNGVVDPASPPHSVIISDPINSSTDTEYVGGAKELDTCTWGNDTGPVTGKDDIGHVMAYAKFVGNSAFFYMGAERIINNGDTHVDFELNKLPFKVFTSGAARPDRSVGDLIISLEYSNGGSNPIVTVYEVTKVTSCGNGETVTVDDITKTSSVHSATNFVDLPSSGFGYTVPQFEFAEASIDLAALGIDTSCPGLSSGSIRTRAGGDVSSSQLKDRVDPFPIDLNNCGSVTIKKQAVPNSAQDFHFTTDLGGDFSLDDDSDNTLSNTQDFTQVTPGTYHVTEAATAGWKLTGISCTDDDSGGVVATGVATIKVAANEHVTCTYTNTKFPKPDLSTQVEQDGQAVSSANVNDVVDDVAQLGSVAGFGQVSGTVDFFVCYDANAKPDCSTGGTAAGAGIAVTPSGGNDGTATSDDVTLSAPGFYCFRAEYTPDASAQYLATKHTDQDTECVQAKGAHIDVTKTADAASVSAGTDIGFKVTVANTGAGNATGVTLTDALPGGNIGNPVHWTIDSGFGDAASFAITGADGSQQLTLAGQPISLAAGASLQVHITAHTSSTSCATYDNTASASSSNDGSDSASASTQVNCAAIGLTKVADQGTVSAGDTIGFVITATNSGAGSATGVTVTDVLPTQAGLSWSIDAANSDAGCSIS
ncbi:MAG TPA: hypothetical protein VGQ31_14150, partial [Candidatus Limnocylindrales bacterium]|nr:hypothetical protein [Candidatus Limnocylindrales bacterium]